MDEALQLPVTVTPHTAPAVTALRQGRQLLPCTGADVPAALAAFRRAAGPLLPRVR